MLDFIPVFIAGLSDMLIRAFTRLFFYHSAINFRTTEKLRPSLWIYFTA